jgi:hypothetical protein
MFPALSEPLVPALTIILPAGPVDDEPVDKHTFPLSRTSPVVPSANTPLVEDMSATLPLFSAPSIDKVPPDAATQKLQLDITMFWPVENFMVPPTPVDKSMEPPVVHPPPAWMDTQPVEAETASPFPALMLIQPLSP